MNNQQEVILELNGIYKTFGIHKALNNLSLSLDAGEVYALLGPNGAGKTTTLNLILGFITPDKGSVKLVGSSIHENIALTRQVIAYLPESVMLPPSLTAIECLTYFSLLSGESLDKTHASEILTQAGLQENAHNRRTDMFSKGMRQKVGLAIALAKKAKLLLLDEPTSGLDASAANELSDVVRTASSKGIAVLMATHDLYRVKDVAHRLGILQAGQLVQECDTSNLSATDIEKLYLEQLSA
ncbi:ABC transporter ATP-binding protein [Paraglaciecola sp. L3A3]|uniref:ABC transporter ATP-binding protein n=1 Tax=Paraglaciecola sp. L3A3 TaxID=2686358 RepID=UPI00131E87D7|nr:ABC transporter ATP-binding protein [Paraglaciecola sp. L3A3]